MKKKDNAALADAFRKLSSAAAEIADALDSTAKKSETSEIPVAESTAETRRQVSFKACKGRRHRTGR